MTALLVLLLAVGASALCSGAETGTYALNVLQLRHLSRRSRSAALLWRAVRSPAALLCTLLVANNVANDLAVIAGARLAESSLGLAPAAAAAWAAAALVPLLFVFGELGPKQLVLADPLRRTVALAPLLALLRVALAPVTGPLVFLLRRLGEEPALPRHQLAALLLEGQRSGAAEAPVLAAAGWALDARGRGLRPFLRRDIALLSSTVSWDSARAAVRRNPDALALVERPGAGPGLLLGARLAGATAGVRPVDLALPLPELPPDLDLAAALGRLRALGAARALVGRRGAWEGVLDLEYVLGIMMAPPVQPCTTAPLPPVPTTSSRTVPP